MHGTLSQHAAIRQQPDISSTAPTCAVGVCPRRQQHLGHGCPVSKHCHDESALPPHILLVWAGTQLHTQAGRGRQGG